MDLTQLLLILTSLALAAGGVVMLARGARRQSTIGAPLRQAQGKLSGPPQSTISTPRPYVPLGIVAVGLIIAYRTYSDYRTLEPVDIAIMFVFIFALAAFMALRFFIVDRFDFDLDEGRKTQDDGET